MSEMRSIQPTGPSYIGGFCFGGLIAVEIAQQLRSAGENIAVLVALEPDAFKNCPRSISKAALQPNSLEKAAGFRGSYFRYREDLAKLEKGQRMAYVWRKVHGHATHWMDELKNAIKTAICAFCVELGITLPISLRSFYIRSIYDRATSNYPLKVLPGSLSVILQESPANFAFPWKELTTQGVDICMIPAAGHTDILKEPHIKIWAEKLQTILQEAQSTHAGGTAQK